MLWEHGKKYIPKTQLSSCADNYKVSIRLKKHVPVVARMIPEHIWSVL